PFLLQAGGDDRDMLYTCLLGGNFYRAYQCIQFISDNKILQDIRGTNNNTLLHALAIQAAVAHVLDKSLYKEPKLNEEWLWLDKIHTLYQKEHEKLLLAPDFHKNNRSDRSGQIRGYEICWYLYKLLVERGLSNTTLNSANQTPLD